MNQMSAIEPSPPLPQAQPVSMVFSGERREFRNLVTRGALLELVTVGFYRFWLATDMRRHLWSHTSVDGDAAEYTGSAKELLIGFFFAVAILAPVYIAYFVAGLEAERIKAFASFPLLAFFYLFGQFAIYRARRYRLTRTVWRGVRFWMDGSGWAYALRAALWGVLMLLTLGLILPWREAAMERYKMRHSYYGDLQGSFEGTGWEFFKRGWWLWPIGIVAIYIFPLLPFVYAAFKGVEWRWWLSGIRFGGLRVESSLRRRDLMGLYWKAIGWSLLLVVLFALYGFICASAIASFNGQSLSAFFSTRAALQSIPLIVCAGIGYLVVILTLNVVLRVYLMRDLWARVAASIVVHNIEAVANVGAKGDIASALGEGFADGLDVAGF